ncbi:MAG: ATPase [Clostridiaceae bacterium]|nr:ATPase [Clostridiaceae bacterium]
MPEENIRHMYAGGNTPLGFFSYFKHIISVSHAKRIFIFKGGPGTGKSTLMRKIGQELSQKGFRVEFIHCSSDNKSLDGIVVPELKIAMMDGTAPHVVDPIYPGVVDEIINLGQFWNEKGFQDSREAILSINKKIKNSFATAYRYLKAAASLKEDTEEVYREALDKYKEKTLIRELVSDIFRDKKYPDSVGSERCMFASAITPRGFSGFLDNLCANMKTIRLSAPSGTCTRSVLESIKNEALQRGYDIETFYCSMDPLRIEHLIIPALNTAVITANEYHDVCDVESCSTYLINELYMDKLIENHKSRLDFNRTNTEILLQQAIDSINAAKEAHDELEKYYIRNMDFDALTKFKDTLIDRILAYA